MAVYQTRPFQRGDVYYINYNDAVGSERSVGRPGLIICNDKQCQTSPTVLVAYLTRRDTHTYLPTVVEVNSLRERSHVLCNAIAEVDKSRCATYYGTLSQTEMAKVDKALADALDLPFGIVTDTSESDRLTKEIADLKTELSQKIQEIERLSSLDVTVERDYYKNLYEAALRRFVDKRLDVDLEPKPAVIEKKPAPVMVPDEPKEKDLVDLNSCSFADLKRCGMKEDVILRVMQARPFKTVEDLKYVHGITTIAYRLLEDRVCVRPVVVEKPAPVESVKQEKLNLNTATAKEIKAELGLCESMAYSITGYRNKNGSYKSLDDLFNVRGFGKITMERIRDKVCV